MMTPARCLEQPALCAADVARGTSRLLLRHDYAALPEVPVEGGRRVDLMALGPKGEVTVVEIKVSRADLLGDGKWREYLPQADRFYWAVPAGFDLSPFDTDALLPERTGLIVADQYEAAIVRDAPCVAIPAPTRKRATLAFARRAARRLAYLCDPDGMPVG